MVRIKKIVEENKNVRTLFFDSEVQANPGQFVMVWIPGVDEKPFSLSHIGENPGITVERKGKFTKRLFGMKEGESLGIRGPYGKGFLSKGNACFVAGGCGIASLAPLIEQTKNPFVILGAKSKDCLIFEKRFRNSKVTTDDGSFGFHGFATDFFEKTLKEKRFDVVYTCGPEVMMKKTFDLCEAHGIPCQASLERFMKCGMGVCGSCEINGFRVCKDGPVFHSKDLRKMKEFGKFARLKSGKKVELREYYDWRSK
jgi:dihydroorotate dehydrogenase electron transfer subunit